MGIVIIIVAVGASVYYAFAIIWPTMVATVYTSDSTYAGWLSCLTGCAINLEQIAGGALGKQLRFQKWQLVISSVISCVFLGGQSNSIHPQA